MSGETNFLYLERLWVARCDCSEESVTDFDSMSEETVAIVNLAAQGWTYNEDDQWNICPRCSDQAAEDATR